MGFLKRLLSLFESPTHSRTMGLLVLLLILAAVPLTVVISQRQQEIRQRAANIQETSNIQEKCKVTVDLNDAYQFLDDHPTPRYKVYIVREIPHLETDNPVGVYKGDLHAARSVVELNSDYIGNFTFDVAQSGIYLFRVSGSMNPDHDINTDGEYIIKNISVIAACLPKTETSNAIPTSIQVQKQQEIRQRAESDELNICRDRCYELEIDAPGYNVGACLTSCDQLDALQQSERGKCEQNCSQITYAPAKQDCLKICREIFPPSTPTPTTPTLPDLTIDHILIKGLYDKEGEKRRDIFSIDESIYVGAMIIRSTERTVPEGSRFVVNFYPDELKNDLSKEVVGNDLTFLNKTKFKIVSSSWKTTQPGKHKIRVIVDANNDIQESNEGNNEMEISYTVLEAAPTATPVPPTATPVPTKTPTPTPIRTITKVSDIRVDEARVDVQGLNAILNVTFDNLGTEYGSIPFPIKLNGNIVSTIYVNLDPGESRSYRYSVSQSYRDPLVTHTVEVGGRTVTFSLKPPSSPTSIPTIDPKIFGSCSQAKTCDDCMFAYQKIRLLGGTLARECGWNGSSCEASPYLGPSCPSGYSKWYYSNCFANECTLTTAPTPLLTPTPIPTATPVPTKTPTPTPIKSIKGNLDTNNCIDVGDISVILSLIEKEIKAEQKPLADINMDGKIDVGDVSELLKIIESGQNAC